MAQFGIKQDLAKAEVSGGPAPVRATLQKGRDGSGMLSVNDQFDRAWRRVGLALDRVGFTVEDRDRSKGLYFVRYADPDAGKAAPPKGVFLAHQPFQQHGENTRERSISYPGQGYESVSQDQRVKSKDGAEEKNRRQIAYWRCCTAAQMTWHVESVRVRSIFAVFITDKAFV